MKKSPAHKYESETGRKPIVATMAEESQQRQDAWLMGACVRIAREMGYEKVITYILASENGASLKAANFTCEGEAGGKIWTGSRKRDNGVPQEMKKRYAFYIKESK